MQRRFESFDVLNIHYETIHHIHYHLPQWTSSPVASAARRNLNLVDAPPNFH